MRKPMYSKLFKFLLLGLALSACASGSSATNAPAVATRSAAAGSAPSTSSGATVPAVELPVTIHVAGAGVSGNLLTPWATYEGGYFKKYNLDVDGVPDIAASTTAVQAVIARDVDVLNITPNAAIE